MATQQEERSRETTATAAAAGKSGVLSATSSPSHEFSFAVSLHSSAAAPATPPTAKVSDKIKQQHQHQSPPLAIDLSPADDIFFHGHLLPLHFLSHLQASSPRNSINSLDSFTLPIRDVSHASEKPAINSNNTDMGCTCEEDENDDDCIMSFNIGNNSDQTKDVKLHTCGEKAGHSSKSKSFSLFGLSKWRKGWSETTKYRSEEERENCSHHQKRKLKFDVSQVVKRYIKMVKPLLMSSTTKGGGRMRSSEAEVRFQRQSYSFSGTVTPRNHDYNNKREMMRGMRGEFSAPASMRTSPTNSGLLLATTAGVHQPSSPVSDSTMEELQAAIQAAIAHCKNSIASGDKSKENNNSLKV